MAQLEELQKSADRSAQRLDGVEQRISAIDQIDQKASEALHQATQSSSQLAALTTKVAEQQRKVEQSLAERTITWQSKIDEVRLDPSRLPAIDTALQSVGEKVSALQTSVKSLEEYKDAVDIQGLMADSQATQGAIETLEGEIRKVASQAADPTALQNSFIQALPSAISRMVNSQSADCTNATSTMVKLVRDITSPTDADCRRQIADVSNRLAKLEPAFTHVASHLTELTLRQNAQYQAQSTPSQRQPSFSQPSNQNLAATR